MKMRTITNNQARRFALAAQGFTKDLRHLSCCAA